MLDRAQNDRRNYLKAAINPSNLWGWIIVALAVLMISAIYFDPSYREAFNFIWPGVYMTIFLTTISFSLALVIGLIMGLARVIDVEHAIKSGSRIRAGMSVAAYNIATFYIEAIRGVPILVQLLYVAFIVFPWFVDTMNGAGADVSIRNIDMQYRVVFGLALAYGAFEAEVFRAGIESIDRGQMEAARSLGMSYPQAMRHVILPQAIRRVLPPLGNDFVAMLKDTSLASSLAVAEVTHLSRQHRNRTFTTFQPLNVAAFLYLALTLILTRGVRYMERRLGPND